MILSSGSVRALVRCPVCQARFRGTAEWSRCGAELTALMLLAAHVYVLRQAARQSLRQAIVRRRRASFRQHSDCTLRQKAVL
jgi:queuine/archaeosine tRNA-ribosyltransferase